MPATFDVKGKLRGLTKEEAESLFRQVEEYRKTHFLPPQHPHVPDLTDCYGTYLLSSRQKHDFRIFDERFIPHLLCELVRFYQERVG